MPILRGDKQPKREEQSLALPVPGTPTPVSLTLPEGLSLEEWQKAGLALGRIGRRLRFYIGDWLIYGQEKGYIERGRYDLAEELFEYDRATLHDLAWVARSVQSSRRREDLKWAHHREVAGLSDDQQVSWLVRAAQHRWSRNQLRDQIGRPAEVARLRSEFNVALEHTSAPASILRSLLTETEEVLHSLATLDSDALKDNPGQQHRILSLYKLADQILATLALAKQRGAPMREDLEAATIVDGLDAPTFENDEAAAHEPLGDAQPSPAEADEVKSK